MTARCAPNMAALKTYGSPGYCPEIYKTFFKINPVNMHTKFEVCSVTVPEIKAIRVLGGGCKPPI